MHEEAVRIRYRLYIPIRMITCVLDACTQEELSGFWNSWPVLVITQQIHVFHTSVLKPYNFSLSNTKCHVDVGSRSPYI